ncbi:MAG: phosphohydrolase [Odoribacter sp.]|nr:phosphohydrolase [Odoribacter sp.]
MNRLVKIAHQICTTSHEGQFDKVGMPYHLHPERVAACCTTDAKRIVALLHDTIEDTDITPEYLLSRGFPQYIVDGILSVTKLDGESYEDFVARAKQNPLVAWSKSTTLRTTWTSVASTRFQTRQ